ncbi:flavodoxin domain-containing protein [Terrimonas sp. NA20]|uniref:Flavodoxin domain-containing protein n=1 Tax=Terrimonas ginsenosidimutans TaxID=2908004 RepID=A0ABS9KVG5_9BACT|nr:flavodoxin domain-containing protein [Terrimonas ginsenosidimutans]MCG2616347.1 flavodoxin domain-containing protein [Terrimonas ginsenosidimutans]
MLSAPKLKTLEELIQTSSREELVWINGYLSALVSNGNKEVAAPPAAQQTAVPASVKKISLVFGTETGNSKKLATQLAAVAKKKGVNAKLTGLDQYRVADLAKEEYLFVVISTQGEGEPPIPAKKFYEYIHENKLQLPNLKYGVLALGDTSYPMYCKTGEDVDTQFQLFGANRILPLQKCDVDYEDDAMQWFDRVLSVISAEAKSPVVVPVAPVQSVVSKKKTEKKFYHSTIQANINLNDRGSNKQTYHIELVTEEEIEYEPGDTIGIVPRNRPEVIRRIIELTGVDPEEEVQTAKASGSVSDLLATQLNICYLLTSTVKKYASIIGQEIPDTRMDLVDLLRIYPVKDADQFKEVLQILIPIAPRLYSVASSPEGHGRNEVHITVARDRFLAQEEQRFGLCSEFLGDQPIGSGITFYVHKDKNFKLPSADKDIIMIGPGTGVAPFRAFLAERDATGATGRNWFFFGDQHFVTDFLYQTEMQHFVQTGVLTKLDLAFSRDQQEKLYVQHRMQQHAQELFNWIEGGAAIYVSGTKDPMSKDVEISLIKIIEEQGNLSADAAVKYLEQLRKEGRYSKDVY